MTPRCGASGVVSSLWLNETRVLLVVDDDVGERAADVDAQRVTAHATYPSARSASTRSGARFAGGPKPPPPGVRTSTVAPGSTKCCVFGSTRLPAMMSSPGAPAPPPAMPAGAASGRVRSARKRDRHRRGRAAFDQHLLPVAAAEFAFAAGARAKAPVVDLHRHQLLDHLHRRRRDVARPRQHVRAVASARGAVAAVREEHVREAGCRRGDARSC